MFVSAIVVAAGRGVRLKSKICKPLVKVNSRPIVIYSLDVLSRHPEIKEIILVVNSENLPEISRVIEKFRIKKVNQLVLGGARRQDSVRNALAVLSSKTELVLIHDAARPFVDEAIVFSAISQTKKYGAAIAAVPVKGTVKQVHSPRSTVHGLGLVRKTLDRRGLWEVQTPQVFRKDLILKAYNRFGNQEVTDDAALVEKLGSPVRVVMGSYFNIKITTPEDLVLAEAIAKDIKRK